MNNDTKMSHLYAMTDVLLPVLQTTPSFGHLDKLLTGALESQYFILSRKAKES